MPVNRALYDALLAARAFVYAVARCSDEEWTRDPALASRVLEQVDGALADAADNPEVEE